MKEFTLVSVELDGRPVAAVVTGETVSVLDGRPSMRTVLDDWPGWLERIEGALANGGLGPSTELADSRLVAPLTDPRNLYMAGANYADHAREMRELPPDAPIEPAPQGPYFFLKPTSTVIGPDAAVKAPKEVSQLDWEIELGAVVGRRARKLPEADALDCIAGYTVINDISARDRLKRDPCSEPPMTRDWFGAKGWATSCPMGPAIVPAQFCAGADSLAMTLRVNGKIEQSSSTAEIIFSLRQQIAFLSNVTTLLPGDVIATGTPAGVGAGKGRFLEPGDEMIAEIEGIGLLHNPIEAE